MTDRQLIIPRSMHSIVERAGYVPAVKVGKTLYCAGQVGRTAELAVIEDPEAQFIAAWENLRQVLEEGGCTFDDVVDVTTFHTDPEAQFETIMKVRNEAIGEPPYPNWTAVGVNWLAGFDFEIKVIARIPDAG